MFDLHFVEEDTAIFGEFDLACSTDEHFHCTLGAEVGFHDIEEAFTGGDVHGEGLGLFHDFCA